MNSNFLQVFVQACTAALILALIVGATGLVYFLIRVLIYTFLQTQNDDTAVNSETEKPVDSKPNKPIKSYNGIPYDGAPSELIQQLPVSTTPPKVDVVATVISSSVPYTYHSDMDLAIKSGKKYASWSMQTALCINDIKKSLTLSMSQPYSNDPHNKWDRTYEATFDSVIKAIQYAISQNFNSIEIGYDYDGVWQYAGGYWQPLTTTSQKYIDELTKITKDHPELSIIFTKIDFLPQYRFSKLVRHSVSKLK